MKIVVAAVVVMLVSLGGGTRKFLYDTTRRVMVMVMVAMLVGLGSGTSNTLYNGTRRVMMVVMVLVVALSIYPGVTDSNLW